MRKMMKFLRIGLMALVLAFSTAPNASMAQWTGQTWDPQNKLTKPTPISGAADLRNTNTTENVKTGNSGSSAASGEIFNILQSKLYSTLVDLRKIVYVISGFGLVMFAVAAIFNKISYKHLGYIMIGLSLLSLMFPFLEYFSGYALEKKEQTQLTFDNYLAASDYTRIRGELNSDVLNGDGEGQRALTAEEIAQKKAENEANALQKIDGSGLTPGSGGGLAGAAQREAAINAGCNPSTMKGGWNPSTGTRTVCSVGTDGNIQATQEVCQGTIKNGSCTKTFGQIVSDGWGSVKDAIQVGLGAGQAFGNTMGAILDSGAAVNQIGAIMNSDMGFIDKIYYAGNLAANTWGNNGQVTRDLYGIIGGLQNMTQHAGDTANRWSTDYENNPTGSNPFTDFMNMLGGYGQQANDAISQTTGHVNQGASVTSDIHTQSNNINAMIARFTGTGGSWADKWRAIFGGK